MLAGASREVPIPTGWGHDCTYSAWRSSWSVLPATRLNIAEDVLYLREDEIVPHESGPALMTAGVGRKTPSTTRKRGDL